MLTGDFNCDDGYEQSKPVLYLKGELDNSPITFDDTFRSYNGDGADGTTFPGKPGDILLSRLELKRMLSEGWQRFHNHGEGPY